MLKSVKYNFLFNFSVSYSGGGVKRLYAFAKWFDANGGATFIIHENCAFLLTEFKNNNFYMISQSSLVRLFNDCGYLEKIKAKVGVPLMYYSYGIPIYKKVGLINWFHLSNVLPIYSRGVPLSVFDKFKLGLLGRRIIHGYNNAEVVSAESCYSLGLIRDHFGGRLVLSVNGSDDELKSISDDANSSRVRDNIAIVLGTYSYKMLADSISVFNYLKTKNEKLKLVIIGDRKYVKKEIAQREDVFLVGVLDRLCVVNYLKSARFYISTTLIENSYNAASEGVLFADESYISDIEPHRELLANVCYEFCTIPSIDRRLIHVTLNNARLAKVKSWDSVIKEMLEVM